MNLNKMDEEETLILLRQIWTLLLIGLYFACFMNEYYYPGFRSEPLSGEEIFWDIQRVLFFGLLALGALVDIMRLRKKRNNAFQYLLLSFILGGLSGIIGTYQYRIMSAALGWMAEGKT